MDAGSEREGVQEDRPRGRNVGAGLVSSGAAVLGSLPASGKGDMRPPWPAGASWVARPSPMAHRDEGPTPAVSAAGNWSGHRPGSPGCGEDRHEDGGARRSPSAPESAPRKKDESGFLPSGLGSCHPYDNQRTSTRALQIPLVPLPARVGRAENQTTFSCAGYRNPRSAEFPGRVSRVRDKAVVGGVGPPRLALGPLVGLSSS